MLARAALRGAGAAPLLPAPSLKQGAPLAASTVAAPVIDTPTGACDKRRDEEERWAAERPRAAAAAPPVLDIFGGGFWWFWKCGAVHYLQQHYDLSRVQLHGSSSGAIVAVLTACGIDLHCAALHTARVLEEHQVHDRMLGVLGLWGGIARRCLQDLLPEDAHSRCTGRVRLRVTAWPSLRPVFIQRFHSKQDVIDACLASGHLPFLLDGRLAATVRGMRAVDGAFCRWAALLRQQPSQLLRSWLGAGATASSSSGSSSGSSSSGSSSSSSGGGSGVQEPASGGAGFSAPPAATPHQHGSAPSSPPSMGISQPPQRTLSPAGKGASRFVLDYINDDQLGPLRMRFAAVRLRPAEGLRQLVRSGAAYAERLHAHGVWAAWLGGGGAAPASRPLAA